MNRQLHIVCSSAPWPADKGVTIDMFNRIKALHKNGIGLHLHCFTSDESELPYELNAFCASVQSYPVKNSTKRFSINTPATVAAHASNQLAENLNKDNYPILLEGFATTGILQQIDTGVRQVCVRLYDNAAAHYKELARNTLNPVKKAYYAAERKRVKKHFKTLPQNVAYACANADDHKEMLQQGFNNSFYIPAFTNWHKVSCPDGVGNLCLFHGNLSEADNEKAALWLLCNVFNKVRVPFVIAGRNPSRRLKKAAGLCQHTCIVINPSDQELDDLIQKAHINVLPFLTKNATGARLKLLHALYKGRHCVVNPAMIEGTGLEPACHVGSNANAIASIISQLYYQPFNEEEINLRKELLHERYDNEVNLRQFTGLLW